MLQSKAANNICCASDVQSWKSQCFTNTPMAIPPGRPSLIGARNNGFLSISPYLHPCHAPDAACVGFQVVFSALPANGAQTSARYVHVVPC